MKPQPAGLAPVSPYAMKTHGKSFHFASHFLGPRQAERASRLYAFCRFLDDTVDLADSRAEAEQTIEHVLAALDGRRPPCPATQDFLGLVEETGMDPRLPALLVQGLRSDLDVVAVASEDELLRYAYHVAGVVGLMMCDMVDVKAPQARPFAIDLGIAMQLTNIARDIDEDARRGQRYVPATWIDDLEAQTIVMAAPQTRQTVSLASERLLRTAEAYYRSAESGLGYLPVRARFAVLVAGRVYRQIGVSIARQSHEPWKGRARVPGMEKIWIALGAGAAFLLRSHIHSVSATHDPRLHHALEGLPGADQTRL